MTTRHAVSIRAVVVLGVVVAVIASAAFVVGVLPTDAPAGLTDALGLGQSPDGIQFEEVALACGFQYRTGGSSLGSDNGGVFVADVDRDGRTDVLAIGGEEPVLFENTGSGFEGSGRLPSLDYPPLRYALFFDADTDGWPDLLLLPRRGEPLFLANDRGSFSRVDRGFDVSLRWGTGASTADYDDDGDLDVFITQNGNWSEGAPNRGLRGGATDGYRNYLFENTHGGFERVTTAGINGTRWSLATSFVDLTNDSYPDIHVANDFGRDVIYVNQRNGTFDRRLLPGTNRHGMASVVRDVDGDGRLDLFVTNIEFREPDDLWKFRNGLGIRNRGNTLLINNGNGTFVDRAAAYGVRVGGWGWAAAIVDFDNDGERDLVHATKYYLEGTRTAGFTTVKTRPSLWAGTDGDRFEPRNATDAGFLTSNGRGLATLDYDNDGDRDVLIADTSGRFKLYENENQGGNWLQLSVNGTDGPTLGTRVYVETGSETISRVVHSRSNFFSQSARTLHVGLGDETVTRVRVVFPDGTSHVFEDLESNHRYVVSADGALHSPDLDAAGC